LWHCGGSQWHCGTVAVWHRRGSHWHCGSLTVAAIGTALAATGTLTLPQWQPMPLWQCGSVCHPSTGSHCHCGDVAAVNGTVALWQQPLALWHCGSSQWHCGTVSSQHWQPLALWQLNSGSHWHCVIPALAATVTVAPSSHCHPCHSHSPAQCHHHTWHCGNPALWHFQPLSPSHYSTGSHLGTVALSATATEPLQHWQPPWHCGTVPSQHWQRLSLCHPSTGSHCHSRTQQPLPPLPQPLPQHSVTTTHGTVALWQSKHWQPLALWQLNSGSDCHCAIPALAATVTVALSSHCHPCHSHCHSTVSPPHMALWQPGTVALSATVTEPLQH
jgi:hypothetical protein